MLAKRNRLVTSTDLQSTVRYGRRSRAEHAVLYWRVAEICVHPRFGFIVAKSVGNAVNRNLVRRRFQSIAHCFVAGLSTGGDLGHTSVDVVIRALPGAAKVDWVSLENELVALLDVVSLPAPGGREARTPDTPKRTAEE